jgi:UDP-N-acetylglucosamine 4,6-dehydratase
MMGAMSPSPHLQGKTILITGGTGSFGSAFVQRVLAEHEPEAIRIYSRDELKQYDLQRKLGDDGRVRYLLGDVRDVERLKRAMRGVDTAVHAAALKQVPACEYNPFEAVQTNIIGTENVVTAAIENHVSHTMNVSTDKAVNPVNLYGATKLCAEKIATQGNSYAGREGGHSPIFSSVRYGNVVGSRGSVVPLFLRQAEEGELTITDEAMTRFWITLEEAVDFVINCLARMEGGEVFVPKIPSMRITDLADALAPGAPTRVVGIRPGEKLHEVLLTNEEAVHATSFDDYFAIYPAFAFWRSEDFPRGEELPPGYQYTSDNNDVWLTPDEIRAMASSVAPVA